jgi:hypothetical protein
MGSALITRVEFARFFLDDYTGAGNPLWAYEDYLGVKSQFFVNIPCIRNFDKEVFWTWCQEHLAGTVICYASDGEKEWWGFTCETDVTIWLLRWANASD